MKESIVSIFKAIGIVLGISILIGAIGCLVLYFVFGDVFTTTEFDIDGNHACIDGLFQKCKK